MAGKIIIPRRAGISAVLVHFNFEDPCFAQNDQNKRQLGWSPPLSQVELVAILANPYTRGFNRRMLG